MKRLTISQRLWVIRFKYVWIDSTCRKPNFDNINDKLESQETNNKKEPKADESQ